MSKTVVITGANRGIGLALCAQYQQAGDKVYAVCRSSSEELQDLGVNIINDVDVATSEGLNNLKRGLKGVAIDILINDAGIMRLESFGSLKRDTIVEQFTVNSLAPLLVTETLVDQFNPEGKVAMITSRMGSVTDNTSGGYYGYRMSKAALNAGSKSLALDLKKKNVAVAIIHPGFVRTDMTSGNGEITPEQAAERIVQRIAGLSLSNTGTFWHSSGEQLPW